MIDLDVLEYQAKAAREDQDGTAWLMFWDQLSEDDLLQLIERVRVAEAERDAALAAVERVAVEIEAVAGGITSSSVAAGYRNGLLRAAQIVRAALDGAEAERDAALARIAELEADLEVAMRPHSECERSGAEAGERIVDLGAERDAAVAAVERVRAIHMRGETRPGEYFCTYPACESYWPCPTIQALGLNEGENDDPC